MARPQKNNKQEWLKVVEFAVVGVATWLDPTAGGLLFLLKLSFQILQALQNDGQDQDDQEQNDDRDDSDDRSAKK